MNQVRYNIEIWPLGVLLCGPGGRCPADAMRTLSDVVGPKGVISCGIPHHLRYYMGRDDVVVCAGTKENLAQWELEIAREISNQLPQRKWWFGCDVGKSSASIFFVLTDQNKILKEAVEKYSNGAYPRDADDFGRCQRLLELIPEWRSRLSEVAIAYPNGPWPKIIERWHELEVADGKRQCEILNEVCV